MKDIALWEKKEETKLKLTVSECGRSTFPQTPSLQSQLKTSNPISVCRLTLPPLIAPMYLHNNQGVE